MSDVLSFCGPGIGLGSCQLMIFGVFVRTWLLTASHSPNNRPSRSFRYSARSPNAWWFSAAATSIEPTTYCSGASRERSSQHPQGVIGAPRALLSVPRRHQAPLLRLSEANRQRSSGDPAGRADRWRAPWGYSDDVAEAVRLVVENERAAGEIYNVGESDSLDIQGWIGELAAVVGWTGRVVVMDEPCPPPTFLAN
jgi:hypothetical protein